VTASTISPAASQRHVATDARPVRTQPPATTARSRRRAVARVHRGEHHGSPQHRGGQAGQQAVEPQRRVHPGHRTADDEHDRRIERHVRGDPQRVGQRGDLGSAPAGDHRRVPDVAGRPEPDPGREREPQRSPVGRRPDDRAGRGAGAQRRHEGLRRVVRAGGGQHDVHDDARDERAPPHEHRKTVGEPHP
jgi:hypothetical protein